MRQVAGAVAGKEPADVGSHTLFNKCGVGGFENGVSWEKLSFCFCGCAFFLPFDCKLSADTQHGCRL